MGITNDPLYHKPYYVQTQLTGDNPEIPFNALPQVRRAPKPPHLAAPSYALPYVPLDSMSYGPSLPDPATAPLL